MNFVFDLDLVCSFLHLYFSSSFADTDSRFLSTTGVLRATPLSEKMEVPRKRNRNTCMKILRPWCRGVC